MNLLDENIPLEQGVLLRSWGIHCRVIGQEIARTSITDENILVLLHRLKQPTVFTRDRDFFKRRHCHSAYGLVWLDAAPEEAALFVRRFLNHPRFQTRRNRLGIVARVHYDGIDFWTRTQTTLHKIEWISR